ncbi:hypothetical protein [Streptomyces sp. NPDC051577]|uniref:hypothetical protein n=1 Tax=Streptomyces sp. NPDC051577 TaxID=3155166 RepID=UPI00341FBD6C
MAETYQLSLNFEIFMVARILLRQAYSIGISLSVGLFYNPDRKREWWWSAAAIGYFTGGGRLIAADIL